MDGRGLSRRGVLAAVVGGAAAMAAPTVACAGPRTLAATPIVTGLNAPWGLAFLPDGNALLTERDSGRILRLANGKVTEVARIADVVHQSESGLLGIAVPPDFAQSQLIYVYYTTAQDNRIARFKLGEQPRPILTGIPKAAIHNGGRIAFGPDGQLYAGTGDATQSDRAQDVAYLGGKILRMTPDGQPSAGNPFAGSVVYSLGHRNVQGLAWRGQQLYASEFGQNRFDELNRVQAGKNYGWPIVEGTGDDPRFVNPLVTWPTSDASPSGLAIRGDDAYLACLGGQKLYRVPLKADGTAGTPVALHAGEFGRLRHVVVAPDNSLWIITNNTDGRGTPRPDDDQILKLTD
ncbi:PQQ-dependent sugar dehydrogenase [Fodinicola acaciae]|uniref:PQQ-dependent sugar dehydrogenase n=1 Tax=Fodinicola acaciae TaxID=2681555 RepID=UPI0013D367C8|nr:PQQ-dependent sugar dehydrogenase [Fodinicola acaciae]